MRRKRLNVTRRAGRFFFRVESGRFSDGEPDGTLVLWIKTARGTGYDGPGTRSRMVEYVKFNPSAAYPFCRLTPGLGLYGCSDSPIRIAHAVRSSLLAKLRSTKETNK